MFFDRFFPQPTPSVRYTEVASTDWNGVKFSFSDRDLSRSIADARRLAQQPHWDLKDLATALRASKLTDTPLQNVPTTIDFTKMRPTIGGLSRLTLNDGLERGKVVFLDLAHTQLVMGATNVGTGSRVKILERIPASEQQRPLIPVLDIHTHPTNWHNKRDRLHFSPADLKSLMTLGQVSGSLVIAQDAALFALKSSKTEIGTAVPGFGGRSKRTVSPQTYTKEACELLGLTLFLLDTRRDWTAYRVVLTDHTNPRSYRI